MTDFIKASKFSCALFNSYFHWSLNNFFRQSLSNIFTPLCSNVNCEGQVKVANFWNNNDYRKVTPTPWSSAFHGIYCHWNHMVVHKLTHASISPEWWTHYCNVRSFNVQYVLCYKHTPCPAINHLNLWPSWRLMPVQWTSIEKNIPNNSLFITSLSCYN